MKRLIILFLVLLSMLSCKDDVTKINNRNLIPRKKFIEILVNIHLADVLASGQNNYRKYEPSDTVDIYGSIFQKYDVTKAEFDSTVVMYIRQPEVYLKVYDEVLLKLNYILDTLKKNNPKFINEAIEE